jgi:hypothetical protein
MRDYGAILQACIKGLTTSIVITFAAYECTSALCTFRQHVVSCLVKLRLPCSRFPGVLCTSAAAAPYGRNMLALVQACGAPHQGDM